MECTVAQLSDAKITLKKWIKKPEITRPELLQKVASSLGLTKGVTIGELNNIYSNDSDTLKIITYIFGKTEVSKEIKLRLDKNGVVPQLTNVVVEDLFHNMHVLKSFFAKRVNDMLTTQIILNRDGEDSYATNDYIRNENIKILKNELFQKIVDYLIGEKVLIKTDYYNEDGDFTANLYLSSNVNAPIVRGVYKDVLTKLYRHLTDTNGTIDFGENNKKKIPKISENINSNREEIEAYFAAVFLSNFDDVVRKYQGDKILIENYITFNTFQSIEGKDKYKLRTKGYKEQYFVEDSQQSTGAEELSDSLVEDLISVIPRLNKKKEFINEYLSLKDFYGLAASLSQFQLIYINELSEDPNWSLLSENPSKALKYYITNIKAAAENNYRGEYLKYKNYFKNLLGTVYSIDNFISKLDRKEKGVRVVKDGVESFIPPFLSVINTISQPLNNSFGATYAIYNPIDGTVTYKELYSHNSTAVEAGIQVYSKLHNNIDQRDLYNEKDIQKLETDINFSNYIRTKFGLAIDPKNIADLKELIYAPYAKEHINATEKEKEEEKIKYLRSYLLKLVRIVRGTAENIQEDKDSMFFHIINREKRITESVISDSDSANKAIKPLIIEMQDIMDVYLDSYVQVPITTIMTASGERIPTYKLTNLAFSDSEVILRRKLFEKENYKSTSYRNLLINGDYVTSSREGDKNETGTILQGTTTKLEIVNKENSKAAVNFLSIENFTASFVYDFLGLINPESTWLNVVIGNYSDKATILAKKIVSSFSHNKKAVIGGVGGVEKVKSLEELSELMFNQQSNFYLDTYKSLINKYNILFDLKLSNKLSDWKTSYKKINEELEKLDKESFLKLSEQKNVDVVAELDYSFYNKKVALNQNLYDYFAIYSSKAKFKEYLEKEGNNLVFDLLNSKKDKYLFNSTELSQFLGEKNISDVFSFFGIRDEEMLPFMETKSELYDVDSETQNSRITTSMLIKDQDGKINPLLNRWMMVNMLFRNEYLNITVKHEYMHSAKGVAKRSVEEIGDLDKYEIEASPRYSGMAKRNVGFTSTYEAGIQGSRFGQPKKINIACISDPKDLVYTLTGIKKDLEHQDGSSSINYLYSKMIARSYPGKEYSGTLKRFGTFITEYGSAIKKDAEVVINNASIMNSAIEEVTTGEKTQISHLSLQRKMLSSHQIAISDYSINIKNNYYFNESGKIYRLISLKIENNKLTKVVEEVNNLGEVIENSKISTDPISINNLFDIWNAIGAQYSLEFNNQKIHYNEGSNDLLFDIVTSYEENGTYPLKDKFIHIISNESVFKSGAVNLNPSSRWTNDEPLRYGVFESAHLGPQLDPGHTAVASKIKEITQVISSLSQNEKTAHLANEVYDDLARMIQESAKDYLKVLNKIGDKELKILFTTLSKEFAKNLASTQGTTLASVISETFKDGEILPFSNKNFFQAFVKNLIVKLNSEFITRYYPGIGAVLNPSHKIIQVYDIPDINGGNIIYTQEDMAKEALSKYSPINYITKEDKIIFGHPGIGKTEAAKTKNIIDFDTSYNPRVNTFIAAALNKNENDLTKEDRNNFKKNDPRYPEFMDALWEEAKQEQAKTGKRLFVSAMPLLARHSQDFDKFIMMDKETFLKRTVQRGDDIESAKLWKDDLDALFQKVGDLSKTLYTNNYLSDLIVDNNGDIIKNYVKITYKDVETTRDKIQLMESVREADGTILTLDTPEKYYAFKDRVLEDNKVYKVISKARDLKPQETIFDVLEKTDLTESDRDKAKLFSSINLNNTELTNIVVKIADLPEGVDSKINLKNKEIIINSAITDSDEQKTLILHEFIGHFGLHSLFKDEDKEVYKNILFSAKEYLLKNVDKLIERSGFTLDEFIENYKFDLTTEEGELDLIEELLARQAEQQETLSWFDKIIGRLQILAAKTFGIDKKSMGREGVIELLLMAKKSALYKTNFSLQITNDQRFFTKITTKNLFDFTSVRWQYDLVNNKISDGLKRFAEYFNIDLSNPKTFDTNRLVLAKYLQAWTQRNLDLLDEGFVMRDIRPNEIVDYSKYFGKDTLIGDIFDDVKDHYIKNNAEEIFNYKFNSAELILPNIYKDLFNNDKDTIAEIKNSGPEYFRKRLDEEYNEDSTDADLRIDLPNNKKVYVKFVVQYPLEAENDNLFLDADKNGNSVKYRLLDGEEKLYIKPKLSKVLIDENNNDVIYIQIAKYNSLDDVLSLERKNMNALKDLLKSFKTINAIVPLMNNTLTGITDNKQPYDLKRKILKAFSDNTKLTIDLDNIEDNWYNNHRKEIVGKLTNKRYVSWEKSHENIAARIPAQSMQSFMPMKNVAYFKTESNDAYVSIWQIFLQGSDFDVDKAYIMGYGFGNGAQMDISTNLFDYSTKEELDAIERLPIPTGETIKLSTTGYDLTNELNWFRELDMDNAFETAQSMSINDIVRLGRILRNIKGKEILNLSIVKEEDQKEFNSFIGFLNYYNAYKGYLSNYGIQNSVVGKIRTIISAPSNQILASEPISTQQLDEGAELAAEQNLITIEKVIKNWLSENKGKDELKEGLRILISNLSDINIESVSYKDIASLRKGVQYDIGYIMNYVKLLLAKKNRFSTSNGFGMFKQQYQAAVGKKDVGIGANGLKVFFALSSYYNDWYKRVDNGDINFNINNSLTDIQKEEKFIDIISSPKLFYKEFYIDGKTYSKISISDTRVSKQSFQKILDLYGHSEKVRELAILNKAQAALAMSSFVSGATDNAKLLIMAKINAVVGIASMHLYMMALGFTASQISLYMNSDLAKYVANNLEQNIFKGGKSPNVIDLVDTYFNKPEVIKLYTPEVLIKMKKTFLDIYDGSQEFSMLSSIFSVNGTINAEPKELNNFLNTLEGSMYAAEMKTFKFDLKKLKKLKSGPLDKKVEDEIVQNVLIRNTSLRELALTNEPYVRKYILDTLKRSTNIKVAFINYYGQREEKIVSLLSGEFDSRYYMFPENKEYRKLTADYYNLIKNTINIFDVLENVPHFREMSNGVGTIFNIALLSSKKFNFVFSYIRDLYRSETAKIKYGKREEDKVEHYFNNPAFGIKITDEIINRSLNTFDNELVAGWLKSSSKRVTELKFSIKSLLKLAGESKITLANDDSAKNYSAEDIRKGIASRTIYVDSGDDFILSLSSDTGIANFKVVMEKLMYKILDNSISTELGKQLVLRSSKNAFGLFSNKITPLYNLKNLNNPISIEHFVKLLNEFNSVDSRVKQEEKILNTRGKVIKWVDLLFLYNLIVNNESYGDLRLTPIFQDHVKDESSLARNYLNYSIKVDRAKEGEDYDLFNINVDDPELLNVLKAQQKNNIFFQTLHRGGYIQIGELKLIIKNGNYYINTTLAKVNNKDGVSYQRVIDILSIIKNQNLIINFNCE